MKRKFTFLMAAFMLLAFLAVPMGMRGQTVTQTSFSDISGNVNNDTHVSYACYKGGAGTAPGVYDNAIRLYQASSNSNTGGYVVIGVGDGYEITSATIQSTMATTTGYKLTDTDPGNTTPDKSTFAVNDYSLSASTDYTVSGISTQYITFACFGTTKTSRLYLCKISITYQSTGGGSQTHTLTFSASPAAGGTVTVGSSTSGSTTLEEGATVNITATPAELGYAFYNWTYSGEGASVGSNTSASTTFTMGTADATLTANFTAVDTYTVTYKANGGTGDDIANTYNEGTDVTVAANTFSYAGHAFTKWTTAADGTGDEYYPGDEITSIDANYTLYAQWEVSNNVVDVLNYEFTGISGTNYAEWSGKTGTSGTVYAGQSGGQYSSIQLRSNNSNSGIITTATGGLAKKVVVSWNSNTENGRTLNVYGKSTAYNAATDLYNSSNQGTLLGTIVKGTSTELTISSDYAFIGMRSNSGAMYLDEIRISWKPNTDVATTTTIDHSGITNTDVYTSIAAGSLSATVTYDNGGTPTAVTGATVTWIGDNDDVATIDPSTGAVTLVAAGTVTFTANYAGESGSYQPSSDTYQMTVTNSAPYVQPTTIEIVPNYTFWNKNAQFSGNTNQSLSGSKDNVSLAWEGGGGNTYANQNAMRFYSKNTLTFTAPTGYEIKSIVFDATYSTFTSSNLSFTPSGFDGENNTWTGSSETVTLSGPSSGSGYAQFSMITITIGVPSSIATPTFSPAAGTYTETQTVTISCTTDGATIYYTTDGSTPSAENGTQGTSVTVNTSMTLKAIAIKDEESSAVATAEYTINLPTEYASIAAFKEAFTTTSTEVVKITSTLTVVYQNGKYLYVQDATGGLLIYDSNSKVTGTYENGQTISNIYGTYTKYKNLVEFIPDRDLPTPGAGDVVEPIDITELTTSNYSDYESRLVRISGIMFGADVTLSNSGNIENVTMFDNDYNEVILRNGFKTLAGNIAETDMANVTGFATIYNSDIQLFPRDNNDIQMILSTMDITSDVTIDFAAILESNEIIEIENGGVLTIGGTFTNNGDLLIEDGAQMKCNSPFIGTIEKSITGYENYTGTGNGGYYLIASPVDAFVNSTLVPTNSNDEYQFDDMDFYWFDGQAVGQEWQNPKNGSADGSINGQQLMPSKKGFLYARKETGVISISADNNNKFPATGTGIVADNLSNSTTAFGKHNLIGNPYTCNAFVGRAYYRMNPAGDDFTAAAASEPIKPLEGVFIVFGETETATKVTFTTTAPTPDGSNGNGNLNINASQVIATRGNSNDVLIDRAIVHFGEGQMLPKFMLNPDNTKLYIPQGNKDYAVVRSEARGEMPVNFKAAENGTYTIDVEAENLEVNYLHLIDNLTGMDVDLLATPSYTFEARKSDIASRFRLVFDANTGNDETNDNFAFINNGELIVNGNGTVQVIDILGRQMFSHEVNSSFRIQNSEFAPGVYVLRLVNGNDVKTQKIVIK